MTSLISAQTLFAIVSGLLAAGLFLFGYTVGSIVTEKRFATKIGGTLDKLRARVRAAMAEESGGEVQGVLLNMSEQVLTACRALDVASMRTEMALQMSLLPEDTPPDEVVLATMHMMRANHPKFTEAEREWSRAWLAKNVAPDDQHWSNRSGTSDPTIN